MSYWHGRGVAVTGAAGFVGSHLCEALVEAGASVLALDNLEAGSETNLESVQFGLRLVHHDITREDPDGILKDAELVFHLAAIANPRLCEKDFAKAYQVNVEGTRRVLESCRSGARLVFLSGAMAYGDPLSLPISETHQLGARDPYSLSKIMGECLTWAIAPSRGLRATVVRNFSTYGPRQSTDYVIPRMISQGLQQGRIELWTTKPTRDFTYVDDMVCALLAIAASDALVNEAVNLGSGKETRIGEVAQLATVLLGGVSLEDLNKEVTGSYRQLADNTKLRRTTGWEPRVTLEEGLKRTIAWVSQTPKRTSARGNN